MGDSRQYRVMIRDMTCERCVLKIKEAVGGVVGVEDVEVNLESGLALIRVTKGCYRHHIVAAIHQAGYRVQAESDKSGDGRSGSASRTAALHGTGGNQMDADLIVVGGGAAGFAAAIQGDESGARVILVTDGTIGGTCVNVGCVPSKTLIRAAEACDVRRNPFAGIEIFSRVSDFTSVIRQKDELVSSLRQAKYVDVLSARENIRLIEGRAQFVSSDRIHVDGRELRAPRIVIATGSRPWVPDIVGLHESVPLTSTSAFELQRLPESIIVLGGRYVALECAQMFSRFGTDVTVLQRSAHLLPTEDEDLTEALVGCLREEGIRIETGVKVERLTNNGRVSVHTEIGKKERVFTAERILCATGRRPITGNMGLSKAGVNIGDHGRIIVDDHLQTTAAGVYAAGDVIGEPAFVYTAAYEGSLAARNALGSGVEKRDYRTLPWVIFTDPQMAGVGLNEKEAERADIEVDVSRLNLEHVPRALAARDTRGFIKLIKERGTDRLLGARILAPEGGEQIMEAAMAIRYGISVSDLASLFHPYLTQAEGIKLCARGFTKDVSKLSCCSG